MLKESVKVFLLILLLFNMSIGGVANSSINSFEAKTDSRATTRVFIEPANDTANVGEYYTISVNVADVTNLYGFDIQLRWGPAVLEYVNHTVTVPVEDYPEGVLHGSITSTSDVVDENASMADSAPGTTYWLAKSSMDPAPSFNGSGTIFKMTFLVLQNGECDIYFIETNLCECPPAPLEPSSPISHEVEDGYFYRDGLGEVPVANLTVWPEKPIRGENVTFDASASSDPDGGTIKQYIWNFGDGTINKTTEAVINHTYTSIGSKRVILSVLDDQGDGSQSKASCRLITVVNPQPVATFETWPPLKSPEERRCVAVANKTVEFDASASYTPYPYRNISLYMWDFEDGTKENTKTPSINHTYTTPRETAYGVQLRVNDSEGLLSITWLPDSQANIYVVERRDIEATGVTASPSELMRGENVTINATFTNRGQADETFNVTAYYNRTATEWVPIGQVTVKEMLKQFVPKWQLTSVNGTANNVNWILKEYGEIIGSNNDTRVKIGDSAGFWTINPEERNVEGASTTIITSTTALTTGGWILEEELEGPQMLNGDFSAGNWSFLVGLHATEINVNATIWVRVLKSNDPNPQADGAKVTVLQNWTALFAPKSLSNITRRYQGNVTMPPTTFTNEYLYIEYQLQVTGNLASNNTEAIFQIGVPTKSTLPRAQIEATTFTCKKQNSFYWDTEYVPAGNYSVMVKSSEVPHETNLTNNAGYANIHVEPTALIASFSHSPVTPFPNEKVLFNASNSETDLFQHITSYIWDFGDNTTAEETDPTINHTYVKGETYSVTLTVIDSLSRNDSTVEEIVVKAEYVPLDVIVDVGTIHFRGEIAEFYILVSRSGRRINASITAFILFNGSLSKLSQTEKPVAEGVYWIRCQIPPNASSGTYTLVVDASYKIGKEGLTLRGTTLKCFLISSTLTGWNATLIKIEDDIATIRLKDLREIRENLTDINATLSDLIVDNGETLAKIDTTLGSITARLDSINATLSGLIVNSKGEILARIDTALGAVTTTLDTINATVTKIDGTTFTINTTLGEVQTSVGAVQSIVTIGITAASILSAIAAIAAIIILLRLKKLGK